MHAPIYVYRDLLWLTMIQKCPNTLARYLHLTLEQDATHSATKASPMATSPGMRSAQHTL